MHTLIGLYSCFFFFQEVQEKASLFAMKTDLCGAIFSILVAFVLVANGDRYGRKISLVLPLVGSLTSSIFLFVMSDLSLPLYLFFVFSLVGGLFGDLATFLGGAFSFIVDCCETQKQKTIRIAVVDLIFGFTSGLGGLVSGYILKEMDFMWTFAMISLFHMVNIFYVIFCLDETVKVSAIQTQSWREGLKDTLSGVCMLFKSSSCKKRILIILLLCTFMTYLFTIFGGLSLYVLYELNAPLCWNAIYIGYGSAVSTSVSVTGFLGIVFLSQYLRDSYLVFIGIFSYMGGSIMAAFANTTLLMMLGKFHLVKFKDDVNIFDNVDQCFSILATVKICESQLLDFSKLGDSVRCQHISKVPRLRNIDLSD